MGISASVLLLSIKQVEFECSKTDIENLNKIAEIKSKIHQVDMLNLSLELKMYELQQEYK